MTDTTQSHDRKPKNRWLRVALVAVIGSALIGIGMKISAHTPPVFGGGPCAFASDPETAAKRVNFVVPFVLSDIDASDAQQAKIVDIVKTAMADLRPLCDKHAEVRTAGMAALSQPNIDRGALETLRAEQMQLVDTASRRIVQAFADAGDVLTPAQRAALVERIQRLHAALH